ncbi:MAG: hypothetical protein L3J28_09545 [Candidatus Polarisedimenticolaceae bacterium]|nr:hypothetical protein [Candidatus Polarisedimenticolaceae bacterium]
MGLTTSKKRQEGAVLLVMLTIVILGAASMLVSKLGKFNHFLKRDQQTMMVLAEAKSSLMGWSVSRLVPDHPGLMPFPDRDGDGVSNCPAIGSSVTASDLIGQLPRYNGVTGCSGTQGLGVLPLDSASERLWYVVSPNLVYDVENDIYPNIDDKLRNETANWLQVMSPDGSTLSDTVAVVIFSPAVALQGQNRAGLIATANYLERYTTSPPGSMVVDNANPNDRTYIAGNPNDASNRFNDRLVYITVAELLAQVDARVGP